ncbi:MAG TPA: GGDEF domain-containing protein [Vicinamibacterales bacterium]|nr:GGDEF domain-containing protein [Vicinamibacterales bacterium]
MAERCASLHRLRRVLLSDQPEQRHRIKRHLLGVASSVVVWGVMSLLYWNGHLEGPALVRAGVAMLVLCAFFFTVFRTRVNLLAPDPSLTAAQIVSSIAVILYAMYYTSSAARDVLAMTFVLSAFFGVFRFELRQFVFIALLISVGYGILVVLLLRHRPQTVDLELEIVRIAALAAVLFWFSTVGGYVSRLRQHLADSRARLEEALTTVRAQADTDELTGTRSRRSLLEVMHRERANAIRTGSSFCICIADIDDFKQINDDFGHQGGDEVLRAIARAGKEGLRITDYLGRYGGDEWLFILIGGRLDGAHVRAEQVRSRVETLRFPDIDPAIRVTLSMGIAEYRGGEDVAETLRRADRALYDAKEAGKNRIALAAEPLPLRRYRKA